MSTEDIIRMTNTKTTKRKVVVGMSIRPISPHPITVISQLINTYSNRKGRSRDVPSSSRNKTPTLSLLLPCLYIIEIHSIDRRKDAKYSTESFQSRQEMLKSVCLLQPDIRIIANRRHQAASDVGL